MKISPEVTHVTKTHRSLALHCLQGRWLSNRSLHIHGDFIAQNCLNTENSYTEKDATAAREP